MLNPSTLTDAVVTTLQSIYDLVTALNNDPSNIFAYHYYIGTEHRLAEAIYKMPLPSIMVEGDGTQGGNFSGYELWKHRFKVVIRAANQANNSTPTSYETLWHLVSNGLVNGTTLNIRQINIIPEVDLMETPSVAHMVDGEEMDYFVATFVIPEIGDTA
jgi:hypothetical protein